MNQIKVFTQNALSYYYVLVMDLLQEYGRLITENYHHRMFISYRYIFFPHVNVITIHYKLSVTLTHIYTVNTQQAMSIHYMCSYKMRHIYNMHTPREELYDIYIYLGYFASLFIKPPAIGNIKAVTLKLLLFLFQYIPSGKVETTSM